MLVDAHCHLNDKRVDLDKVMENARKANVKVVHSVVNNTVI